jgi:hypothetical protein
MMGFLSVIRYTMVCGHRSNSLVDPQRNDFDKQQLSDGITCTYNQPAPNAPVTVQEETLESGRPCNVTDAFTGRLVV